MFKQNSALATAVVVAIALYGAGSAEAATAGNQTVAQVGQSKITATDLQVFAQERGLSKPTKKQRKRLVDDLVDRRLLAQKAIADGAAKKPRIRALIAGARDTILASVAAEHYLAKHPITDKQLRKRYDTQVAHLPGKQYKLAVIVASTESEANAIEKKLHGGASFKQVADKRSALSAKKAPGGELGWEFAKTFVPPLAKAIRDTPKGHITAPVWTPRGWWIVRVEDKRATRHRSFAAAKKGLREQLVRKQLKAYVQQLRAHADVHLSVANGD